MKREIAPPPQLTDHREENLINKVIPKKISEFSKQTITSSMKQINVEINTKDKLNIL